MKFISSNLSLMCQPKSTLFFVAALIFFASATPAYSGGGNDKSAPQQFFTTSPDGSEKHQGYFDSRPEVYLHTFVTGASKKSDGKNGDYVYQVTNPNGRLLLSSDPAECRIVRVVNGVIVDLLKTPDGTSLKVRNGDDNCNTQNSPDGIAGSSQHHDTNIDNYSNGSSNGQSRAVQLMPFVETTNPGHVYKVWMTPWDKYVEFNGDAFASPTPVCSTGSVQNCAAGDVTIGFAQDVGFSRHSRLRTHNFKVMPTTGNQSPIADAGADQGVVLLSAVTLDGSNSSDPDGDPLTFNWTIAQAPTGSAATLSDITAINPSFNVDVIGDYVISLVVNDGTTNSSPDSVMISTLNSTPTANAGTDQSKTVNESVTLDGSASNDSDGDPLSYSWQFVSKPTNSMAALDDANSITPSFILDDSGDYEIELTVNDGQIDSSPDSVIISTTNSAPIADAGQNQSAPVGTLIQLDGSGSTDIDGDNLEYFWSFVDKPEKSLAVLSNEVTFRPEFTLDFAGTYTVQLIVNDGLEDSSADTVTISTENSAPVANAGDDQSATINSLIQLDGSGSTDVDGDNLTYAWSLTSVPQNNTATLLDATTVMPSFTIDAPGDYVAQLTVDDGTVTSVDTVLINFLNTAPIAEAGPAQSAIIGSIITLDGASSFDIDGDSLIYSWTLTDSPVGSTTTLLNKASANPSFTIDVSGDYVIQLVVDDGQDKSLPDTVTISTLNSIPVANAGDDSLTHTGDLVMLDGTNSNDADSDVLNYTWSLLNKPTGSNTDIIDVNISMPSLTTDLVGIYIAQLIVNDGTVNSDPDTVSITAENITPLADAGPAQRVASNVLVTLDGSASSDGDNDDLTYQWEFTSIPASSAAVLLDETTVSPSFTTDEAGDYVIALIVNDGTEDSVADTVTITSGNTLSFALQDELVGVGRTTIATATLEDPAPAGGQSIDLVLDDPSLATLNTTTLNFAEGDTAVNFSITGVLPGLTEIRGSGDGVAEASATVQITQALVSMDQISVVAPSEMTSIVISITEPAPPQGLIINLTVLDPSIATLSASSVFVPAGQFTPTANAQITGVDFGTTAISAVAVGYATDVRDVTVALKSSFDPASVRVTLPFTGSITLQLDAPAPVGGVTFDLTADDDIVSFANQVIIPEGQTQTLPIELTGLIVGDTILRATSAKTVEATAAITVDATEVYLERNAPGGARITEAVIGFNLQDAFRVRLEAAPPIPVDVTISVPENSGMLLSTNGSIIGGNTLTFDDVTSTSTPAFVIQGTALGDDVPFSIEITDAGTSDTLIYDIDEVTVDVDQSGLYVDTRDYPTTSFSNNRTVIVRSTVLYDSETPTRDGERYIGQRVRPGINLTVPMQSSDDTIASLDNGTGGNDLTIAGNSSSGTISVDPHSVGEATISIASYPTGFALPTNQDAVTVVTVTAPTANLLSGSSQITEAVVGVDLQTPHRVRLQNIPPSPVDIHISVPSNSGVLLSPTSTALGQSSLVLTSNFTSTSSPLFYIQGVTLGDDEPFTIEVFETGTTTPIGYDIQAATVDVDPSGIVISDRDRTTTSFSPNFNISTTMVLLNDGETGTSGTLRAFQQLRGGISLNVPMLSSDPNVVALPNGATGEIIIMGGQGNLASISLDPQNAGTSTVSVDFANMLGGFVEPNDVNRDAKVVVTVTAAQAYLSGSSGGSYLTEVFIGKDLQSPNKVFLAAVPPAPVDIHISTPPNSGILFAKTATEVGSNTLLVSSNVTSQSNHSFFIQGTALGDDIQMTIDVFETGTTTPIGYDIQTSTADVDPAGLRIGTTDITTTTFSNNSNISISSVLLHDAESNPSNVGSLRSFQAVRGGENFTARLESSNPNVVALESGAFVDLTINEGTSGATTFVDPLTAGTAIVSAVSSVPVNLIEDSNTDLEVMVTVSAPDAVLQTASGGGISTTRAIIIGDELQAAYRGGLTVAPPAGNPVDITIELISPTVAVVSDNATLQGNGSVILPSVTSTNGGNIFLQGLSLNTATQVKVSAPGYNDTVYNLEVVKSGFRLTTQFGNNNSPVDVGQSRVLRISPAILNDNNTYRGFQSVRGGASFDITALSSDTSIGTVTSPVTLSNGDASNDITFSAIASGATTVTIQQPAGFSPPAGQTSLEMTVN